MSSVMGLFSVSQKWCFEMMQVWYCHGQWVVPYTTRKQVFALVFSTLSWVWKSWYQLDFVWKLFKYITKILNSYLLILVSVERLSLTFVFSVLPLVLAFAKSWVCSWRWLLTVSRSSKLMKRNDSKWIKEASL